MGLKVRTGNNGFRTIVLDPGVADAEIAAAIRTHQTTEHTPVVEERYAAVCGGSPSYYTRSFLGDNPSRGGVLYAQLATI